MDVQTKPADLLVQCTPAGLGDRGEGEALAAAVALDALPADALGVDLIYGTSTPLLEAAHARGQRTQDGLPLLLHQGARAFELWTGEKAPLNEMRAALQ